MRALIEQAACPKRHRPLPEGAICAEVRSMWRCRRCFKLRTGFAIPYGRCRLCDGELQMFTDSYAPEAECTVREAVEAELDTFRFYQLARDQARHWEQRAVLERLCEAEMSVLSELEKQDHPHLATRVLELEMDEQNRLAQRLFRGICLSDHSAVRDPYQAALAMERQSRDRFRVLSGQLAKGPEREVCRELAEKGDGHVGLLEAELGLIDSRGGELNLDWREGRRWYRQASPTTKSAAPQQVYPRRYQRLGKLPRCVIMT